MTLPTNGNEDQAAFTSRSATLLSSSSDSSSLGTGSRSPALPPVPIVGRQKISHHPSPSLLSLSSVLSHASSSSSSTSSSILSNLEPLTPRTPGTPHSPSSPLLSLTEEFRRSASPSPPRQALKGPRPRPSVSPRKGTVNPSMVHPSGAHGHNQLISVRPRGSRPVSVMPTIPADAPLPSRYQRSSSNPSSLSALPSPTREKDDPEEEAGREAQRRGERDAEEERERQGEREAERERERRKISDHPPQLPQLVLTTSGEGFETLLPLLSASEESRSSGVSSSLYSSLSSGTLVSFPLLSEADRFTPDKSSDPSSPSPNPLSPSTTPAQSPVSHTPPSTPPFKPTLPSTLYLQDDLPSPADDLPRSSPLRPVSSRTPDPTPPSPEDVDWGKLERIMGTWRAGQRARSREVVEVVRKGEEERKRRSMFPGGMDG